MTQKKHSEKSFKASETLLGIETEIVFGGAEIAQSFKASETLLGIETWILTPRPTIGKI